MPLPVEVRDASSAFANYAVDASAARDLVSLPGVELLTVAGRAFVSVAAIEYRDNDLGQYHEVAVAFVVRDPRSSAPAWLDLVRGRVGAYIHRLPVTTRFSCEAGREIWGFPKIVAEIDVRDDGDRRTTTLTVAGEHALTLSVARRGRLRFREFPMAAYSFQRGIVRKTPFTAAGERAAMRPAGAVLTLGPHEIGRELRSLGLPKRPLVSGWVGAMRMRFGAPEIVGATSSLAALAR